MNDLKSVQIDRDKYKIELPLLEKGEIDTIDNYFNEISDDFMQKYCHDKEIATAQRIIMNLRNENKQLKRVISKIKETLNDEVKFDYLQEKVDIYGVKTVNRTAKSFVLKEKIEKILKEAEQ